MSFNELNSVEHYIIHQLSGVNLNESGAQAPQQGYGAEWQFKPSELIRRTPSEVLDETELKDALIRLNPEIAAIRI